jgi:dienelactone hydrolase
MTPQDVEFKSNGTTVRAHLYLPSGDGPHPIVVMAGGWCYVRNSCSRNTRRSSRAPASQR